MTSESANNAFHKRVLENGLTIIAETDPDAKSVGAGFFVGTGARDEDPSLMGVSHFLEHMMFKGTDARSAEELNEAFDAIGATNNAYTTREMTCFYAHVIPEHAPGAIDLLSDMMRPALRQSDFDTEKEVILEEIAMYADNPFFELYERCVERHYGAHGLGHRVLGTNETVGAMTREQMSTYFRDRYSADNTTVALAGNIDFDHAVEQIERACGGWERTGPTRDNARPSTAPGASTDTSESFSRGYIIGLCDAPGIGSEDRYDAALLAQILGGQDNSRLHWALLETGIAEEAVAAYDGLDNAGDFFLYASGDPDQLDEIWGVVTSEIRSLAQTIDEEDLAKLRAKMLTSVTLSGERPSGRMQRLGRQWCATGSYRTLDDEIAMIHAVTKDSVLDLLERYPLDNPTVSRMVPA